ncbi:MAG: CopG family transcriptional regulator [Planctomycetia bacterium]|nr:CopG family transcriptional regulator [Planctomycetia bacterium]
MDTQISLPPDLQAKIEREARARGMSVPDFVRTSLEWAIAQKPADDPLFADTAVFRDDGPEDLAANHDDYLYGDAS